MRCRVGGRRNGWVCSGWGRRKDVAFGEEVQDIRIMKADTGKKKKNPIPTGALAALIKQRCVVHKRLSS